MSMAPGRSPPGARPVPARRPPGARPVFQLNNALTYIANGQESFTGQPLGIAIQM